MDRSDGFGVKPRTLILKVIASDTCDSGVTQLHSLDRLSDSPWFITIERLWLSGCDVAEIAPSGADIAANEESCFAILPALEDVGAGSLLTDGMKAFARDE
jgi:hypothetical protein